MIRAAALALAASLAACAPQVIWTGHTADRRHTIEIAKRGNLQWIAIDGDRRGAYRSIAAWSIATAGDRIAYAAVRGGAWVVVDGDVASADWRGIGEVIVDGAHTAYSAERAGGWYVVVDGAVGPRFDAILAGTLRLAGGRAIYVARDGGGAHAVAGAEIGPAWDGIGQLVTSPDGAHLAYAARRGADAFVVADGVVGPPARAIAQLAMAGPSPAYAALDEAGAWHVVTGGPGDARRYLAVRAIVVRGEHVAWVARDGAGDVVGCDGVELGRAARVADRSLTLARGCDLAYVTLADDGARFLHRGRALRHDEIGPIATDAGGDHLGYAARTGDHWSVFLDGVAHPGGDWASAPVWSPDGARVGYLARRGARTVAIVDGREHPFDLVMADTLAFSHDGAHWAVIAGDLARERLFFAIDGERRVPLSIRELYSAAAQLSLTPLSSASGEVLRSWSAAEAEKP